MLDKDTNIKAQYTHIAYEVYLYRKMQSQNWEIEEYRTFEMLYFYNTCAHTHTYKIL